MGPSQTDTVFLKRSTLIRIGAIVLLLSGVVTFFTSYYNRTVPRTAISSFIAANGTEYKFPCPITTTEAISSIERVNSDECKIVIGNAACRSYRETLFPAYIKSRCPSGKYVPYRSAGCFSYDSNTLKSINVRLHEATTKFCVDLCLTMGFRYAGLINGDVCYCYDAEPNESLRETELKCNIPCTGNPKQRCGGRIHLSVYETGVAKHPMEPIRVKAKPGDAPARIAFLLMCHKRNVRQVYRLLGAIYDRRHYYYIHVDARQPYLYRELLSLEKDFPNVHVARQRFALVWGCDSQLQAMLHCVRRILEMPDWQADFIINMSESDFLLKHITKLTNFLTANPGRNFLSLQKILSPDRYLQATGYNKNYVECSNRMWGLGYRTVPKGIAYRGGSDWFCVSRDFAQYMIDANDDLVADLQALMEYTGFGTEIFFHTLLFNSRFCQTFYDSSLRTVSWKRGIGCSKSETIDWMGCSPLSMRIEDYQLLMAGVKDDLFLARKFNSIFDQSIILKLEEQIIGKHPPSTPNLNSYWENVYHHLDGQKHPRAIALTRIALALIYTYRSENHLHHYDVLNVREITHYFTRTGFYGFLIRYGILMNNQILELELLVKPRNMFNRADTEQLKTTLKDMHLHVSNSLDRGERLPTDFDQVLSANEKPMLVVVLPTDPKTKFVTNHTVRVEWTNPNKEIAFHDSFKIMQSAQESKSHVLSSEIGLPLKEGAWEARVYFNESAAGSVEFLLTSNETVPECHTCSKSQRAANLSRFYAKQCTVSDRDIYFQRLPHPRVTLKRFFEIDKVCAIYEKTAEYSDQDRVFENCYDTLWSSLAPDPKSDIQYVVRRNMQSRGN